MRRALLLLLISCLLISFIPRAHAAARPAKAAEPTLGLEVAKTITPFSRATPRISRSPG